MLPLPRCGWKKMCVWYYLIWIEMLSVSFSLLPVTALGVRCPLNMINPVLAAPTLHYLQWIFTTLAKRSTKQVYVIFFPWHLCHLTYDFPSYPLNYELCTSVSRHMHRIQDSTRDVIPYVWRTFLFLHYEVPFYCWINAELPSNLSQSHQFACKQFNKRKLSGTGTSSVWLSFWRKGSERFLASSVLKFASACESNHNQTEKYVFGNGSVPVTKILGPKFSGHIKTN